MRTLKPLNYELTNELIHRKDRVDVGAGFRRNPARKNDPISIKDELFYERGQQNRRKVKVSLPEIKF